jgi:hypothetical protein
MHRHQLLGVVIGVSCAAGVAAAERSPSRPDASAVVIDIAFGPTCTDSDALALARRESSQIWAAGGLSLRWVGAAELRYAGPPSEWLVVQCATSIAAALEGPEAPRVMPIAAMRFIDARPTNTITLSLVNAQTLLRQDEAVTSGPVHGLVGLRTLRLGRMLGRAIAHEVGHFVNRSGVHTRRGLMRATHSVAALTGTSLAPFSMDAEYVRLLQARRGGEPAPDTYQY